MTPRRISAKFFAHPDPGAPVDLRPIIGLFHRFIRNGTLDGLLVDVADYTHIPAGPGVILIGHDVDYGVDLADHRAGLLTTRKRYADLPLAEVLRDTLRRALIAVSEVDADDSTDLRFATSDVELRFVDQLATPNTEEAYESVCEEIEPVLIRLFGSSGFELARASSDDPRKMLTVAVAVAAAPAASELLERVRSAGGA